MGSHAIEADQGKAPGEFADQCRADESAAPSNNDNLLVRCHASVPLSHPVRVFPDILDGLLFAKQ
jgi:hypothetical protein